MNEWTATKPNLVKLCGRAEANAYANEDSWCEATTLLDRVLRI